MRDRTASIPTGLTLLTLCLLFGAPRTQAQLSFRADQASDAPLTLLARAAGTEAGLLSRSVQASRGETEPPPIHRPLLYGLGAKLAFNGLVLYYTDDVFHGFAPIVLVDPLVTAFAVHLGNDERGSFPLTMLASYVSLYLATHVAYGYDLSIGSFEEGADEAPLWMSMGVQLGVTLLIERLTGRNAPSRRR